MLLPIVTDICVNFLRLRCLRSLRSLRSLRCYTGTTCFSNDTSTNIQTASLIDTGTNYLVPVPKAGYNVKLLQESSFGNGCNFFHGSRFPMVALSVFILVVFSIGFPVKLGKLVDAEVPHPMSPDDPENPVFNKPNDPLHGKPVIFNDEGKLVEYTDRIFLIEVDKNPHTPYAYLFKGFEMKWAKVCMLLTTVAALAAYCY